MVPWGAKACAFKVDYYNGCVEFYLRELFDTCAVVSKRLLQLSQHQLIDACVLAGCDYVKNIKGDSFKTAVKHIRQHGAKYCDRAYCSCT